MDFARTREAVEAMGPPPHGWAILGSPQYTRCLRAVDEDLGELKGRQYRIYCASTFLTAEICASRIVRDLCIGDHAPLVDRERYWDYVRSSINATTAPMETNLLISGLTVPEAVGVGDGFVLRPAKLRDIQALEGSVAGPFTIHNIHWSCVLSGSRDTPIAYDTDPPPTTDPRLDLRAKAVQIANRLHLAFDSNPPRVGLGYECTANWVFSDGFGFFRWPAGSHFTPLATYTISGENAAELRAFLATFDSRPAELEVAVMRYAESWYRSNTADALLDLSVSLEAILTSNDRSDISFRFAFFGAFLAAQEGMPFDEVFDTLRALYLQRSGIVHGATAVKVGDTHRSLPELLVSSRRAAQGIILSAAARLPVGLSQGKQRKFQPAKHWGTMVNAHMTSTLGN